MSDVLHQARGHWRDILPQLGVPADLLTGDRSACPICGGFDRFQYHDKSGDGDFYCRQCGAGNAVVLLRKRNRWTFEQALAAIAQMVPATMPTPTVPVRQSEPTSAVRLHREARPHLDLAAVAADNAIKDVVERHGKVALKPNGREWRGLCPFHKERTPSFAVVPKDADQSGKGFFHCFGCGASGDQFDFVQKLFNLNFVQAVELLGGYGVQATRTAPVEREAMPDPYADLVPLPVPAQLPQPGATIELWNPKRLFDDKPRPRWRARPSAVYAYRSAIGELVGCVLRIDGADGKKITPQIRFAKCHDGKARWACWSFDEPRPLYRVGPWSDLHLFTWVVEGEKCADALAELLRAPVATWPGGTNGAKHCDWSTLRGRRLILWPDADQEGHDAMLGRHADDERDAKVGAADLATAAGAVVHRIIEWNREQPKGWDVGDAIADGWSKDQVVTYARQWARSWTT
jgi:hypothetical protein